MSDRILLIEPDGAVRRRVRQELLGAGWRVEAFGETSGAWEALEREAPDLVLAELTAPELGGVEFCRRIKVHPLHRTLPVVLTGEIRDPRDTDLAYEAGAAAFLPTPFTGATLRNTLREVAERRGRSHEQQVLVVDDSATVLRLVERGLSEAGFQVRTARNGREALAAMAEERPDLVLSDLNMPEMDGIAFREAVMADPALRGIPFVVMSTVTDRAQIRRMMHRGAAAYLSKPFRPEQVVILVRRLLTDQYLLLLAEKERSELERRYALAGITSLVQALEARDAYTRGHSEGVAEVMAAMARETGFAPEEVEAIREAGRLHDIGKIGVRDDILLKPGRLTDEEFGHIRQHPTIGSGILRPIASLARAVSVVLHHHERYDGGGYPGALAGEAIPHWARIAAVADTYHALVSDRPYRAGMPGEKALAILRDGRGSQFCPDCVDCFLALKRGGARFSFETRAPAETPLP
jgi:response regulator RpfG family c-di-GMP phosphodiesterase